MQFLNPIMLLSLFFLGPLIAIYMLRNKYRNIEVASNYIWDKLMEKSSEIKKIQKFKKSLLFFVQSMVIILAALGMSKLFMDGGISINKPVLVIMDNSISASSDIEKYNESLRYANDYLLENKVKSYELASFNESVNLLDNVDILDIRASNKINDYEALDLFIQNQKMNRDIQIILFTDDSLGGREGLTVKKYPSSGNNIAISGYSIENGELIVQVSNYGKEDISEVEMNLYLGDEIVNYASMNIDAGATRAYVFSLGKFDKGSRLKLLLNIDDDVYFDNDIDIYTQAKDLKVLVVDYENPFLISALESIGCKVFSTDKYSSKVSDVDYVIFHKTAADDVKSNYMVIDYEEEGSNDISQTDVFNYSIESNMIKYQGECVIFSGHLFNKNNSIIASGDNSAAFYEFEGSYKRIYFGFDFDQTDLIIKPGFVMMLDNLMNGDDFGSKYRNYLMTEIDDVDFSGESIFNEESGIEINTEDFSEGFYQLLSQAGDERYLSINEINEDESNIFRHKEVFSAKDSSSIEFDRMDLSNIFIFLMLLLIIIEWWLYYNECKI